MRTNGQIDGQTDIHDKANSPFFANSAKVPKNKRPHKHHSDNQIHYTGESEFYCAVTSCHPDKLLPVESLQRNLLALRYVFVRVSVYNPKTRYSQLVVSRRNSGVLSITI
jgi:hypothetical protein